MGEERGEGLGVGIRGVEKVGVDVLVDMGIVEYGLEIRVDSW